MARRDLLLVESEVDSIRQFETYPRRVLERMMHARFDLAVVVVVDDMNEKVERAVLILLCLAAVAGLAWAFL